jgi:hypothetical protein
MASVPQESPQVFSAGAETQLRDALTNYVSTWDDERHALLRAALERLCTEAHERGLGPEKMLVTVKAIWAAIPDRMRLDSDRTRVVFDRLLGHCLDAYYGESAGGYPRH